MSHNGYSNIKKYAAFLFMVFTVLSGSSENFNSGNALKAGRNAFIDILAINKLFIQGIKAQSDNLSIKSLIKDNDGLRDFLDINADSPTVKQVRFYMLLLLLATVYINDSIARNNTWRRALF